MPEAATAPAMEAPAAPPAPAAAPPEVKAKPIPLFRSSEGRNDGASRALKEGREKAAKAGVTEGTALARDPKTGKFLGGENVPAERREKAPADEGGTLAPDFQAREQVEQAPPEQPPAEQPAAPFSFEFNGKTFKDQKELSAYLKNMDTRARSSQQLAARLQNVLNEIEAGNVPRSVEREVEKKGVEAAVTDGPKNPFEVEFIDTDHPDQGKLWAAVDRDLKQGETTLALGRLFKAFEDRLKSAMSYRDHTRNESLAGVNAYFAALNQIHSIGTYFKSQMDRVDEATGEPLYPLASGKRGKEQVEALTKFLHRHKLERTPENFELAYDAVVRRSKDAGAASTPKRVEAAPVDHSQAASAAAAQALRSAAALPSPREEPRPLSLVESLRQETLRPKTAIFRGSR